MIPCPPAGERPWFSDFLKFVKDRANLVNIEFGEDLVVSPSKERRGSEQMRVRSLSRATTLVAKFKPDPSKRWSGAKAETSVSRNCPACLGQHGLWKCEKFKGLSIGERGQIVLSKRLCFKCLNGGHFKDRCPKGAFKFQVQGCAPKIIILCYTPPLGYNET